MVWLKDQLGQMLVFTIIWPIEEVLDEFPAHLLFENAHVDFVVVAAGQQGREEDLL